MENIYTENNKQAFTYHKDSIFLTGTCEIWQINPSIFKGASFWKAYVSLLSSLWVICTTWWRKIKRTTFNLFIDSHGMTSIYICIIDIYMKSVKYCKINLNTHMLGNTYKCKKYSTGTSWSSRDVIIVADAESFRFACNQASLLQTNRLREYYLSVEAMHADEKANWERKKKAIFYFCLVYSYRSSLPARTLVIAFVLIEIKSNSHVTCIHEQMNIWIM